MWYEGHWARVRRLLGMSRNGFVLTLAAATVTAMVRDKTTVTSWKMLGKRWKCDTRLLIMRTAGVSITVSQWVNRALEKQLLFHFNPLSCLGRIRRHRISVNLRNTSTHNNKSILFCTATISSLQLLNPLFTYNSTESKLHFSTSQWDFFEGRGIPGTGTVLAPRRSTCELMISTVQEEFIYPPGEESANRESSG